MPIAADDPRLTRPFEAAATRYTDVPFQRAGASGVQLPKVSLGLWQNFGRDRSFDSQREIVLHAFDRGVVHIDLANNYGPPYGSAESTFGAVLESGLARYRDELFVTTKAGYDMWPGPFGDGGSRKYLVRSLEQSLQRMNTDYVDVFYSHRVDPDTPIEETATALADIVRSGKALYVGISNYPAPLAKRAYELLAEQGVKLLLHQPRYSLFDRTPEAELFPLLRELSVGSAVFSPLAQGLLTRKYIDGDVPADSRAANSFFLNGSALTDGYLDRIRGIDRIAQEANLSIPQLAIAWVLRDPVVTTAIIGASRTSQIDDAVAASQVTLSDDVVAALDEFAAPVGGSVS
ncbi:L-glyceraldehyde 3-phosphate reductase [Microbacterium hydrocarbonoxydans]|uniref:L-glyceraldehyde 3-phosphate reductase n=1 Tax=Microbacterium hydrocarbonoxydans TaxID=273678 RepID=A0A0M2HS05_9MICO|nr:aldo/keto reductase [Microbacterium hydrocarbonoxydans]KJL47264.1 L-glyceraldehyde 3-phosphate reductase [Microbacterium hydrocarbonoxydans]